MALQGKPTPERGFANFMTGLLDGVVKGQGIQMARGREGREQAQDLRSQEAHMMQQRIDALTLRQKDAEYREFQATEILRRKMAEAQIGAEKVKGSNEMLELKQQIAEAQAARAEAQAELARIQSEAARDRQGITQLLNQLQGFAPQGEGPEGDVDTRDVPAAEPGGMASFLPSTTPSAITPGQVPGGRRILTGPPQEGNVMEGEDTQALIQPGDVARTFLPPGATPPRKKRSIPYQQGEVDAALKSEDADKAFRQLLEGAVPFGEAMEKKKRENPLDYQQDIEAEIDRHQKQYPGPYSAYREPGGMQSKLSSRMLQIFTDPDERAWQTTRDTDVVASQAVSELSLEELISENSNNALYQYLGMDRANNGNYARYSGRLLNLAMRDVFGANAQNLMFSDDLDYTLRQVVEALYSDEMAANGEAQIGFTEPLTSLSVKRVEHGIMKILDAYWEPVRAMEKKANAPRNYYQTMPRKARTGPYQSPMSLPRR